MCNVSKVNKLIVSSEVIILLAEIMVGVAVVLNGYFFSASGSPIFMILVGLFCFVGSVLLGAANKEIKAFFECMESPEDCKGKFDNLTKAIKALLLIIGLLGSTCLTIALAAWVPWIPIPLMLVVAAALVFTAILVINLLILLNGFLSCMEENMPLIMKILGAGIVIVVVLLVGPLFFVKG